jgi:hypothetical protein
MRGAINDSAYSSTADRERVGELIAMKRIGASAGLTFLKEGGLGMSGGRLRRDWEIAV